ncbi:cytochrome P450 [Frankia sp. Ag45/Mut15]|uniref:Cytochrome P450 n=1 Tax=Frankia umida TaxID=573489 RepID=A0ABT0K5M1_9ACTN|nr:cytochrome P450 [Frankia umida]MCK9879007.1 cytochrome P450 [Frankia umida]
MSVTSRTDPAPADVVHCPFDHGDALEPDPLLERLRDERPITRITMAHGTDWAWLVTRYDDVRRVVSDPRFSRAATVGRDLPRMTPEPIAQPDAINLMDPPDLTRLRRLAAQALAPEQIARLTPRIQTIVDGLLDELAAAGPPAEFTRRFAARLPLDTICELMAISPHDRPQIRRWVLDLMSTSVGAEASRAAKASLRTHFRELAIQRRRHPGDDLISTLATAHEGANGANGANGTDSLDDTELGVMALVLTVNGHDTSTYQLSNILYTLLTHPAELARVRAHPELLDQALEEILRHIPFRQGVGIARIARTDVDLGGVTIRAGEAVHVSYLAANRDPAVFDHPGDLDLDRPPTTHFAFGHGIHYCLGANLARAVLRLAFATLLARFPTLRLAVPADEIPWHTGSIWRYPERLPITW